MYKLKYAMKGGAIFTGNDKHEIVLAMQDASFTPSDTIMQYMGDVATRIDIQFGIKIDYYNADTFVDQLTFYGLLEEIL